MTSTIADVPCRTMLFTPNARLFLEAFDPKLGLQLYRFLVATLAHGFVEDAPGQEGDADVLLAQLVGGHAGGADTAGESALVSARVGNGASRVGRQPVEALGWR